MANTISITQAVQSKAETSVVISWQTDATADYLWYSINNGDTWIGVAIAEGTAGSYGITGLNAESPYQIKTRVRRKGTQITADSSALQVVTYAYPSAISTPDFVIGRSVTIGLFNPLSRSVTVALYDATNTIRAAGSTAGTSITFTPTADPLYQTIPNAQRGAYSIRVLYDGQSQDTAGGDYQADRYTSAPEIGSVSYQDINPDTYTVTGNDAQIIQGKSVVRYSVTGIAAKKYASIVSCVVSIGNQVYRHLTINGSTASGGDSEMDFPNNAQGEIRVTDSRGFITAKSFTVTMLEWHKPSAIVTLRRRANFYSETDITANADYSSLDGKNTVSITYEARKSGTSTYTISGTLTDEVMDTFTADNAFAWDVKVTVSDLMGETSEYNLNLPKGMPILFVDQLKSSIGVNCFPKDENSLEVGGVNLAPSAVTLSLESNFVVGSLNTYVNLPLGGDTVFGNRLSMVYSSGGGGVMVGPHVDAVLVSGQINIKTAGGAGVRGVAINSGAWTELEIDQAFDNDKESALIIPATLIKVQEGQIIYLAYKTSTGADLIYGHNNIIRTALTVTTI